MSDRFEHRGSPPAPLAASSGGAIGDTRVQRQNRVTPFGDIVAVSARGTLMGNRGCLHDGAGRIVRRTRLPAWIYCLLEFKGRKRTVMSPGRYTELFFLDEATALAAGIVHAQTPAWRYKEFISIGALPMRRCWAKKLRAGAVDGAPGRAARSRRGQGDFSCPARFRARGVLCCAR